MNREQLPPIGEEIADHVEAFCKRRGMDPSTAQEQGDQVAELMLTLYAGQKINFPSDPLKGARIKERNSAIRAEYDGKNTSSLVKKYGLSRVQVWKIVNLSDSTS